MKVVDQDREGEAMEGFRVEHEPPAIRGLEGLMPGRNCGAQGS
jgi:hypothetical protein